jgi:hypothetical protein
MLKVTSEKLRQFTPDRNAFHRKGGIGRPHCGIIHMKDICVKDAARLQVNCCLCLFFPAMAGIILMVP